MINDSIESQTEAYAGYYQLARCELLNLLGAVAPTRALEIGCGAGSNLVELKRRWPHCITVGLELRPDAAALARLSSEIDQVQEVDVLNASANLFRKGEFDLIVLSHVLEHFAQPELVLARAKMWLREGGRMLVALPNVRHVSVLWDLVLKGEFRYRSSGILDQTHLRFYTRRSAVRFLGENGLLVKLAAAEFGGNKSKLLNRLSLGAGADLAAYAYNFLVEKE